MNRKLFKDLQSQLFDGILVNSLFRNSSSSSVQRASSGPARKKNLIEVMAIVFLGI